MVVTRFAPSPTGYLHIGGLRTALLNYLWARKNGGKFLLRIEDTDLARNSQEAAEAIVEAFKWVGLSHDGIIEYQSQRFDIYKKYVAQLLDEGKAYYCYMTKEELDTLREEQQKASLPPRYDNRYRDGNLPIREGVEPVVRIKAPLEGTISFEDGVKGSMNYQATIVDDFIIARSDGTPTYNFVVAVDDALMGVTEVIRGDDHLSNTPKQIVVYNALGFTVPKFNHVPMINNNEGKKLSKRDGATDVMEYKRMGYLPEALLNFLIRLGWSNGDQEIFSRDEMLALFDPKNINKSASCYNADKLLWLNQHYIKNTSNNRLSQELHDLGLDIRGHDKREILLDSTKERAKTLIELRDAIAVIVNTPESYDEGAVAKHCEEGTKTLLREFISHLNKWHDDLHLPSDYEACFKNYLEVAGVKMPKLAQPLRIALTGSTISPSISDSLAAIGKETVIARIEQFLIFLR